MANPTITFYTNETEGTPTWEPIKIDIKKEISWLSKFLNSYYFKIGFPFYTGHSKPLRWIANKLLEIKKIPIEILYRKSEVSYVTDVFWIGEEITEPPKWWQRAERV